MRWQDNRPGQPREFYQVGAELIGESGGAEGSEAGDEELVGLFADLLARSGVRGASVVLGFAGALDVPLARAASPKGAAELADSVARRERQSARSASPELLRIVEEGVPDEPAVLGAEAARRLERLQRLGALLAERESAPAVRVDLAEFARFTRDPELGGERGPARAYYDGILFRAFSEDGQPLGAGGRYDGLFAQLGAPVSAAGFSLGVDGLAAAGEPGSEES